MEAKNVKDELLASELREAELRDVVDFCLRLTYDPARTVKNWWSRIEDMREVWQKTLSTNGKAAMQKQLDEVVRVLGVLKDVEWGGVVEKPYYLSKKPFPQYETVNYCLFCNREQDQEHTETCELALLIKDLETKQNSLVEAIKGVG